MKTIILKTVLFGILSAGLVTSCVNDDYDTPNLNGCTETSLIKNREVSEINATAIVTQHQNIEAGVSDVIEAYVVSSDIGGNFFKSISMQTLDGSKAFSVPVDATSTFINYEPGRKVLIKMDGLYTDIKYGGMRIGGLFGNSSGGAEVGRLPEAQFKTAVQRSCTVVNEDDLVQHLTIAEAKNDANLNKLIEFDNVQFTTSATATTYYDANNDLGGATNHQLMDLEGNTVIFRTSSFSNFAAKPVASGSGTVRGIMSKFGSDYQFMVRSENDINLTGTRFTPLLNETFSGGIGSWTSYSVVGAEVWTYSSQYGYPGLSTSGGMMKMSGYNGTNKTNDDWLISPVQNLSNLSSTAFLSFENAYKFAGPAIEVLVSNNYSGTGDVNAAGVTWTTLTGVNLSLGNYVYANSGPLSLASFVGAGNENVYIAFRYTSSTCTTCASTWEIDNVKITP